SDPNGLLYDISGPKQGAILFDSTLPEIRAIAIDPNGVLYAAAMGGAVATGSAAAVSAGAIVANTPTVITVTETKENVSPSSDDEINAKPGADQAKNTGSSTSASAATSNTAVVEVSGVEKSAIYRISPDHTVETLRTSKEDNVYDLSLDRDSVIFSTDDHGRIYRLNGDRTTLLAEPGDGETTRLCKAGSVLYAGLSNPARLLAFGAGGSGA